MSRWLVPAALVLAVAGCSDDSESSRRELFCTQAGCNDGGVAVEAPGGTDGMLTICVEGDCKQARLVGSSGRIDFPGMAAGSEVTATLVMADGSQWQGEAVSRTQQPNGPDCPPTCVIAHITLVAVTT